MPVPSVPLLDAWERNRSAQVKRSTSLKLWPHQLSLLRDPSVVASLTKQNVKTAGLLPTDGTEVFRRFTPESLVAIEGRKDERKLNANDSSTQAEENCLKPSSKLEAGKVLPFIFGGPPPELFNTPLEELDPFYQDRKTFIVINKGNTIFRFNAEPTCHLSPFNTIRRAAIKILTHSWFSMLMLLTILTNCVFMTMRTPTPMEYVFIGIYTFEAAIKVISRGVHGSFSFLRDPWSWLDIIIILVWYFTAVIGVSQGALQVLRVLKIYPLCPGLKSFGALTQSVKKLGNALVITLFTLVMLSTVGLHLFMGDLRNKCVAWPLQANHSLGHSVQPTPDRSTFGFNVGYDTSESDFDYWVYTHNPDNYYFQPHDLDALRCGNRSDAGVCPSGYTCLRVGNNPNYGFTNYDTFGWAFLSVFRIMVHDFWENLYQLTLRSAGKVYMIFYVAAFFITFYLCNLILAMVAMVCADQNNAAITEAKEKEEEYAIILQHLKNLKNEVPGTQERTSSAVDATIAMKNTTEDLEELPKPCSPCCYKFADIFLKWDCCPPLKKWMHSVMTNPFFDLGICICIVLNTILMAMEHYPLTYSFAAFLSGGELVFASIYMAEMVFKVIAMDPYHYFQKGWNIFESILVISSLLELSLVDVEGLSVLRCFRLMRIFRLGRFWPTFHLIIKSWATLCKLAVIIGLTVFGFAVVGMHVFGWSYKTYVCKISPDCELPRWHMNDFFHAFLLVFRIMCGEWIETMWECMEVAGEGMCITFYSTVIIIGNLVLMNVFIAFLLSSFSGDNLAVLDGDGENNVQIAMRRITNGAKKLLGLKPKIDVEKEGEGNTTDNLVLNDISEPEPKKENGKCDASESSPDASVQYVPIAIGEADFDTHNDDGTSGHKAEDGEKTKDDAGETLVNNGPPMNGGMKEKEDSVILQECCPENCVRCCPCLSADITQGKWKSWWTFRRACYAIVENKYFETFMIFVILLSSMALVFEDIYLKERRTLLVIVDCADYVFTCIFIVEMLLKWVAYGFKVYFTNGWCWLDFLLINASIVRLMGNSLGYATLGPIILRSLKALRPLRALSRFERMRVVVNALVGAIPSIFNMLLGCLTLLLIFSIMGVNFFAGRFYHCLNTTSEKIFDYDTVANSTDCYELMNLNPTEVEWRNAKINFDNVAMSYLSLFQVVTFKGWLNIMYAAVDSDRIEDQPVYEYNIHMYLYFVIFIIFGSFVTLIFFTGVIIEYFSRQRKISNDIFMTESQKKYCNRMKKQGSESARPLPRPKSKISGLFYNLVTNKYFDIFMMAVILFNMVLQMIEAYDQSELMEDILHFTDLSLTLIFLIEFILKMIGLRKHYFTVGLNVLDFVVLVYNVVGVVIPDILYYYFIPGSFFSMLRLARIGRVLRLIGCAKGARALVYSMKMSLPAVSNMCLFLFLITFIYSIFGMFSFAYVKHEAAMNDMFNFETFGNSFLCLSFVITSAGWDGFLIPIMNSGPPDCDPDFENSGSDVRGNCGSPGVGIVFLCSYLLISFLVTANMCIAIILEIFNITSAESTKLSEAGQDEHRGEVQVQDQPPVQELL